MENLKKRIKISETIVEAGGTNMVDGQIQILKNHIVIMEALNELLEEKNKPRFEKA